MSLNVWQRSIVDETGNVMPSASVEVLDQVTSTLVQLYEDYDGLTTLGNPISADTNGFVRFYAETGRYKITATSGALSRAWEDELLGLPAANIKYDRTAAEISAGVTPVNYQYPELYIERYNGGNMRTAIADCFAVASARGSGTIEFEPGKDCNVGNITSTENLFTITNLTNVRINGNHARIVCNTTGSFEPVIFNFINPNNLTISDLNGIDNGVDLTNRYGSWLFYLQATGAAAKHGNVRITNCHAEDMIAFLVCGPADDARIENVFVDPSCSVKNTYYGIACQNNGDNITGTLNTWNARRAYIGYGNKDVDLTLNIFVDTNVVEADATCLIKCYDSNYPTRNIKVRNNWSGDLTNYTTLNAVKIEHDTATGDDGLIENIDAEVNLNGITAGTIRPFTLSAYSNGVEQTTTTDSVWRHIRLSGDIEQYAIANKANHVPIHLPVSPTTECDIILSPSLVKAVAPVTFANNFVFMVDANSESRFYNGDLTAATIVIPLAGFDTLGFTLEVAIWAHDDHTDVAMTNVTYQKRVVHATNAGAGNVAIVKDTAEFTDSNGSASTFTIAASGENINVTFSAYSGANAQARVDVRYVMPMRNRL